MASAGMSPLTDSAANQISMDVRVLQLVHIPVIPDTVLSDVLPQEPGAVAALIVDTGGLALVDHNVVHGYAAFLQLHDGADRFCAKCDTCHRKTSLRKNHHGGSPSWCGGAASRAAF